METPVSMLVMYRVKSGREEEFTALLEKHWAALKAVDLVTATPARMYRGYPKRNPGDGSLFVETFEWINAGAPQIAHQLPEVMAIWEPMGPLLESMEMIALAELGGNS